jgi:dTDP-4-dehydrorhamnose 3,5-epimerase
MALFETTSPSTDLRTDATDRDAIELPDCHRGIGSVILTTDHPGLICGVRVEAFAVWPDDRGHFLEVLRVGRSLAADFPPATTQVSAAVTYPGVVKAFHYHLRQFDCWTVAKGMLQVVLVDLRKESPTFGTRNTLYVGDLRPWRILIPPGVAHGYKVLGVESAVLVYATSRLYDPADEWRIPFNDERLAYDWETQFK